MNQVMKSSLRWLVPILLLLTSVRMAGADAIDGNWCHTDGRRFSIRGPEIVTPGGNRIVGDYSRHHFSYTVPASEPAGGKSVFMTLLDEYTVHLRVGEQPAGADPSEQWKRCAPSISIRENPSALSG